MWAAEAIKKVVNVPVIASGSITLPEYAEEIIASGKGDFVGLGRPLWADPEWPNKAMHDHPEDIRHVSAATKAVWKEPSSITRRLPVR